MPGTNQKDSQVPSSPVENRRHLSRKQATIFALVFAGIGSAVIWRSLAAPPNYAATLAQERSAPKSQIQSNPQFNAKYKNQQVKLIKASKQINEETKRETLEAITFNYTTGETERVNLDLTTGALSSEKLKGRAQSSQEERDEAVNLIKVHPTTGPLLTRRFALNGGFVVTPPAGVDPKQRVLQFKLTTADRGAIVYIVLVNLSTKQVISVATPSLSEPAEEPK